MLGFRRRDDYEDTKQKGIRFYNAVASELLPTPTGSRVNKPLPNVEENGHFLRFRFLNWDTYFNSAHKRAISVAR